MGFAWADMAGFKVAIFVRGSGKLEVAGGSKQISKRDGQLVVSHGISSFVPGVHAPI